MHRLRIWVRSFIWLIVLGALSLCLWDLVFVCENHLRWLAHWHLLFARVVQTWARVGRTDGLTLIKRSRSLGLSVHSWLLILSLVYPFISEPACLLLSKTDLFLQFSDLPLSVLDLCILLRWLWHLHSIVVFRRCNSTPHPFEAAHPGVLHRKVQVVDRDLAHYIIRWHVLLLKWLSDVWILFLWVFASLGQMFKFFL